ncbi:MAG: serine hydrolase [Bacteroidota bacterium]
MRIPRRLLEIGLVLAAITTLILTTVPLAEEKVGQRPISFLASDPVWAERTLAQMSQADKIGQLVVLRVDSGDLASLSGNFQRLPLMPGQLALGDLNRTQAVSLVNQAQAASPWPLMMGQLPGKLSQDLLRVPTGMALGQFREEAYAHTLALDLARQSQALGVQLLYLPSLVEGFSGAGLEDHIQRLSQINQALATQGILTCLHPVFPFVQLYQDSIRQNQQLAPYHKLISQGFPGWVLGSPPQASRQGFPPPVSALQVNKLSFPGLIQALVPSDSRDFSTAVRQLHRQGAEQFLVRLEQLEDTREAIEELIRMGELTQAELDRRVKKILLAKVWTGAQQRPLADTLPQTKAAQLALAWKQTQLLIQLQTLLRDPANAVPLGDLQGKALHILALEGSYPDLVQQLRFYGPTSNSRLERDRQGKWPALSIRRFGRYDPVVILAEDRIPTPALDPSFFSSLEELAAKRNVIVVQAGKEANLSPWPKSVALVHVHQLDTQGQQVLAQMLMGGLSPQGRLPLDLNEELSFGQGLFRPQTRVNYLPPEADGLRRSALQRIDTLIWAAMQDGAMPGCQVWVAHRGQVILNEAYGYHTYAKRRPVYLTDLYDLASMTKVTATTVAAMHMIERGKIRLSDPLSRFFRNQHVLLDTALWADSSYLVYQRPTPDSLVQDSLPPDTLLPRSFVLYQPPVTRGQAPRPLRIDSIKLSPDSVLIVKTYSGGKVKVRSPIMGITLAELLTHHSGLSAALPILPYLSYRRLGDPRFGRYFQPREDSNYQVQVARNFYLRRDFQDSIWEATKAMRIDTSRAYRYSDANLVLVQRVIDSVNRQGLDEYLQVNLYESLGMQQTGFRPLEWTESERIIPTESDQTWRYQLLRGYVHDETSALLGGVAGNAGLFGNANDLGHLYQMLLNGGSYGGKTYLRPSIVQRFTTRQRGHRGYGFDLPPLQGDYYLSRYASRQSWGHTGFTGTCVWVDPEEELVYIFLSNRIHPRDNNGLINTLRVRQRVHDAVYEAILEAKRESEALSL